LHHGRGVIKISGKIASCASIIQQNSSEMHHPVSTSNEKKETPGFVFRRIRRADNEQVARLIRTVMTEFGCVGEGYSINDPEIDDMFGTYNHDRAAFFVIAGEEGEGRILGCGGVGPLPGEGEAVCELKKMYFYPELRGHGLGRRMVERCLQTARELGYTQCYLETVDRMKTANLLYRKMGFERLDAPMGATGHCSCEGWYVRNL
jgi:putative acetyltransferase